MAADDHAVVQAIFDRLPFRLRGAIQQRARWLARTDRSEAQTGDLRSNGELVLASLGGTEENVQEAVRFARSISVAEFEALVRYLRAGLAAAGHPPRADLEAQTGVTASIKWWWSTLW